MTDLAPAPTTASANRQADSDADRPADREADRDADRPVDREADRQPGRPVPRAIGALIFSSRWLQAPLYLGLIVAQAIYVFVFMTEL
ncbi:MAG TPA: hypothetical protein VIG28_09675, partial [Leifsonia sp.]